MNIRNLLDLQSLDSKIKSIDNETDAVKNENNLSRLKEEYLKLKIRLEKCENIIEANVEAQDTGKSDIEGIEQKIAVLEKIKYSEDIDTVEKLESINKEIDNLKDVLNPSEDNMIKLIEHGENIEKEIAELRKKMNFLKKKHNVLIASVDSKLLILNNKKTKLESQRTKLQPTIENDALGLYEKVKRVHDDPVAWVQYRVCDGCKIEIGAIDYEKVKANKELIRCQNCGRILMYNDKPNEVPSK